MSSGSRPVPRFLGRETSARTTAKGEERRARGESVSLHKRALTELNYQYPKRPHALPTSSTRRGFFSPPSLRRSSSGIFVPSSRPASARYRSKNCQSDPIPLRFHPQEAHAEQGDHLCARRSHKPTRKLVRKNGASRARRCVTCDAEPRVLVAGRRQPLHFNGGGSPLSGERHFPPRSRRPLLSEAPGRRRHLGIEGKSCANRTKNRFGDPFEAQVNGAYYFSTVSLVTRRLVST